MTLLAHMIASERIPHALLFHGPRGAQLAPAAIDFAKELVGNYPHPDVHEFFPEGKSGNHPITSIRRLTEGVGFVPYQAPWKIFIVHEAERMLRASSHALLKTFEEPTAKTIIILLSHHPEKLLATILSRCQKIAYTAPPNRVEHQILEVLAGNLALEELEEGDEEALFETVVLWFRDRQLLNLESGEGYLTYPEYGDQIQKSPLISLDKVEKSVAQACLGRERSIKLSTCLEALFLQLGH